MAEIGANLRALRSRKQCSLGDVAHATGLSASFLSLVETGKSDISVGRLQRLVEFYGVSISELTTFGGTAEGRTEIARAEDPRTLATPDGVRTQFLARPLHAGVTRCVMTFEPDAVVDLDDYHLIQPSESFFLILVGELHVELEHGDPIRLRAGDSLSLRHVDFRRSMNVASGQTVVFVEQLAPSGAGGH